MATENTKLWFESLESIFRDIHNIARDLQFAEEAHRTTAETIRTAKDAIRAAEETHRKGSEAFHRMKETLRTLQESESDMSGACKAWQDSIRANNVNAEIVNKHFQKLARSRQSSYSQTPTPSMNSDHIPNELLLSGHHSGYTPELSQPTSPNRRSSSRAESPLGRLPNTHKTTKRHAVNVNSDPPSHADTVLSGVSSRYASTQPRSIASNHLGQWSSAQLMSELAYNTAPINSSPVQDSQEKQQAKAHTSASIAEYLKSEKNHESSHHEEPAMDTEDVRGHVCLSCLRSWEKSLKDKVPLKEGCVYNPGETDCSECIALKRHGPQECRKVSHYLYIWRTPCSKYVRFLVDSPRH